MKLARVRKPKATHFISYVGFRPNKNISIICTYKYIQLMYPKAGLVKETKG
jgi:hypothetical protein